MIISTVRTYLKAIALIDGAESNWVASTSFAVCRPNAGIDSSYLYRIVPSAPFVESVVASSNGVSYPAINPSTLGSLLIPVTDLATQKFIVDFLDRETARIDLLIDKVGGSDSARFADPNTFVSLLLEKRSALITAAVTGQLQIAQE